LNSMSLKVNKVESEGVSVLHCESIKMDKLSVLSLTMKTPDWVPSKQELDEFDQNNKVTQHQP